MRTLLYLATFGLAFGQPLAAMQRERPVEPEEFVCPTADPDVAAPEIELPVQDYDPAPAMWKIADEDTTIYLFGTYHVLPEGFRWRTPLLDRIIQETDEVVFESRDDEEPSPGDPIDPDQLRFMALMAEYEAEVPLSQRISERNRPKLVKLLKDAGIPLSRADYLPPMMTMFGIAVAMYDAAGSQSSLGVETVIEKEYRANNRPISAIEDPIQVMENLFKIDEDLLITSIEEGLDEWDGCDFIDFEEMNWEGEHAWAQGKLEGDLMKDMFDDPFSKVFYEVLLVDRNREWNEWVKDRMTRPGNLLLAVGAGHMEGPDSLVLMLEADNVSVERIQ
ncbi:MAG: TraB/GumN family protein [Pseudomonadota bacterium]